MSVPPPPSRPPPPPPSRPPSQGPTPMGSPKAPPRPPPPSILHPPPGGPPSHSTTPVGGFPMGVRPPPRPPSLPASPKGITPAPSGGSGTPASIPTPIPPVPPRQSPSTGNPTPHPHATPPASSTPKNFVVVDDTDSDFNSIHETEEIRPPPPAPPKPSSTPSKPSQNPTPVKPPSAQHNPTPAPRSPSPPPVPPPKSALAPPPPPPPRAHTPTQRKTQHVDPNDSHGRSTSASRPPGFNPAMERKLNQRDTIVVDRSMFTPNVKKPPRMTELFGQPIDKVHCAAKACFANPVPKKIDPKKVQSPRVLGVSTEERIPIYSSFKVSRENPGTKFSSAPQRVIDPMADREVLVRPGPRLSADQQSRMVSRLYQIKK